MIPTSQSTPHYSFFLMGLRRTGKVNGKTNCANSTFPPLLLLPSALSTFSLFILHPNSLANIVSEELGIFKSFANTDSTRQTKM